MEFILIKVSEKAPGKGSGGGQGKRDYSNGYKGPNVDTFSCEAAGTGRGEGMWTRSLFFSGGRWVMVRMSDREDRRRQHCQYNVDG